MKQLNNYIEDFLTQNTFNNIDILLSNTEEIKLDEKSLERKIVTRQRGGYCFEGNQYFFNFLKRKGFDVSRKLARVVYGGVAQEKPKTHQLTIVSIEDKRYIVDVAFGPYTPCGPIPLSAEEVKTFNERVYRVKKVEHDNYQLEILKDDGFFSLYQFDLNNYYDADFMLANYYTSTHKDSKFTCSLMLSNQMKNGTFFINNLDFSIISGKNRKDRPITSAKEMGEIIREYFKINLNHTEIEELYDVCKKF